MSFTVAIGSHRLELRAACFGARGNASRIDEESWQFDAEGGIAIFLLGDDAEDGTFLARAALDPAWETTFFDDRWHQLALRARNGELELLLKLECAGAPIPAFDAATGDGDAFESAAGPALWLTVQPAR